MPVAVKKPIFTRLGCSRAICQKKDFFAYVKFPIPESCYNGQTHIPDRFGSSDGGFLRVRVGLWGWLHSEQQALRSPFIRLLSPVSIQSGHSICIQRYIKKCCRQSGACTAVIHMTLSRAARSAHTAFSSRTIPGAGARHMGWSTAALRGTSSRGKNTLGTVEGVATLLGALSLTPANSAPPVSSCSTGGRDPQGLLTALSDSAGGTHRYHQPAQAASIFGDNQHRNQLIYSLGQGCGQAAPRAFKIDPEVLCMSEPTASVWSRTCWGFGAIIGNE